MQLGWMQMTAQIAPEQTPIQTHAHILQSDRLGIAFTHLSAAQFRDIPHLPVPRHTRIVMPLTAFEGDTPRQSVARIRHIYDHLGGKMAVRFCARTNASLRTSYEVLDTLLSETSAADGSLNIPEPRPEVLMVSQTSNDSAIAQAAAKGFHVMSPEGQSDREIAAHWPRIVAGATHAAKRACPSQWHVARGIFISDTPGEINALKAQLRQRDATRNLAHSLICGTEQQVSAQLRDLRQRIGPFGVLHCVDPGLDEAKAASLRQCLAQNILPALAAPVSKTQKEFERQ